MNTHRSPLRSPGPALSSLSKCVSRQLLIRSMIAFLCVVSVLYVLRSALKALYPCLPLNSLRCYFPLVEGRTERISTLRCPERACFTGALVSVAEQVQTAPIGVRDDV